MPGIIPREPRVGDFLGQGQNGNPGPSAQVPPEVLRQLANPPPKIDFPKFVPPMLPVDAPARHEPFAAPSWLGWEWVAGIFVLSLLAGLLRGSMARKQTGLEPEGAPGPASEPRSG
jgi:hypothetical protein